MDAWCMENYGVFLKDYEGFHLDETKDLSEKINASVFIYQYDAETKTYYYNNELSVINKLFSAQFHVLYLENAEHTKAHFLFVSNPDKLINGKVCHICGSQVFNMKDSRNYQRDYEKHMKKCEKNGGKIVKKINLDPTPMPFAPHLNNREMLNSIVNGADYKYFGPFAAYDFETCGVKVGENFGKKSELVAVSEPITVANTIRTSKGIESKCFSIRNSTNFVNDWLQ
jgi:hypothetical protein